MTDAPTPAALSEPISDERLASDPIGHRTDVGYGYWHARALLSRMTTQRIIHTVDRQLLDEVSLLKWRETLDACADAFAAFVLKSEAEVTRLRAAAEAETAKVTRFEVIDHRDDLFEAERGRQFVAYHCAIGLSYQDGGGTLKVFVADRAHSPAAGASETAQHTDLG